MQSNQYWLRREAAGDVTVTDEPTPAPAPAPAPGAAFVPHNATLTGTVTTNGPQVLLVTDMGASTVVGTAASPARKSLTADVVLSFGPTPAADTWGMLQVTGHATTQYTVSVPGIDASTGVAASAIPVPAGTRLALVWHWDGAVYAWHGIPQAASAPAPAPSPAPAPAPAPTITSATINASGSTLTLAYSSSVSAGAGGSGGVTLSLSGGAVTASYVSGAGTASWAFSLSRTVLQGETGTTSYTQPGNGLEATSGGADVATYSGVAVTNSSTQTVSAPTITSATINAAGTSISIVLSASVSVGAGGNGGVALSLSGGAVTAAYSGGSGSTTLTYTLSRVVNAGETGTLAYTQPGNGLEATSGGADVATVTGRPVTNGSTQAGGGGGSGAASVSTFSMLLDDAPLGTTLRSAPFSAPAGSFVWAAVAAQEGGGGPLTASDGTNTYQVLEYSGPGGDRVAIVYGPVTTGVSNATLTVTWSTAARYKFGRGEVLSGMAGVLLDSESVMVPNAPATTGALTWGADAVIVGVCSSTSDAQWANPVGGLTEVYDQFQSASFGSLAVWRSLNVPAGSQAYTFDPAPARLGSALVAAFAVV